MKKGNLYCAAVLLLCMAWGAGCTKDAGLDFDPATADGGKYTLPAITATFDAGETRTSLGTNQVVNWS
ncbi:MAG: hypothetical protein J1E79_07935, partial [Rikenella sp.]|nr:hypothetical protein [Rikenella sp.]